MDPVTDPMPPEEPTLEQLEADLAAVESAMDSLDRIAAAEGPGPARAAEIDAVVSPQRFPLSSERPQGGEDPRSELVGDRLLDQ